ncbi:MAG: alkaline phosphatase family protein [Mycobacteriales bacterium]
MVRPRPEFGPRGEAVNGAGLDTALRVLLDPALAHVVELVAWLGPEGAVHVANAQGSGRIVGQGWEPLHGHDPLGRQDALSAASAADELADPHPPSARNHYPFASARLAQVFRDPARRPDIVVVHSDGHYWPERGGHLGEHGSLSVRQSRAPLVLAGHGVRTRGVLERAARVVDVAPTLLHACGLPIPVGLDGAPLADLVASGARHVVGLLWDGACSSGLLDLVARGKLPSVGRLVDQGCALAGGAIAEFPSVTLVNHTSALTGLGPGRHGILHNEFYDRVRQTRVVANDITTWHQACDLLREGVRTLWEHVGTSLSTACVNEPIDRGAAYSTFDIVRQSGATDGARSLSGGLPPAALDPHADQQWVAADPDYAWSTQIDGLGLAQVLQLWSPPGSPPELMWWNTTLTDTGHHGGGAHSAEATASLVDADRRLGVWLDLAEERGLLDDVTVLLTADHGSVAADPGCRGDWDEALRAAGVALRDEAYGFLYLGGGS